MTPKEIVQKSSDGIVKIEAGDNRVQFGTGFILDGSGLVATNLHVVAGTSKIMIKLHDGTSHPVTQIAGVDPNRDLAILRIQPAKVLTPLRLGDSDQMTAGDQVTAIGNPLGVFEYSVSSGLVSARRLLCSDKTPAPKPAAGGDPEPQCPPGGLELLQISAPISEGSSGGPLFNQFGEVIGVTTAFSREGQAINFAVPSNYLKPLVAQPVAIALDRFAAETKAGDESEGVRIDRMVPKHAVTVLDGCNDKQLVDVVDSISSAIDIGAPLYNKGEIEACFRIYEGTSTKLERDPPCQGVGKAFGDGLLRASTLTTYKEKAWALRDTFDGLLEVARQRGVRPTPTKP